MMHRRIKWSAAGLMAAACAWLAMVIGQTPVSALQRPDTTVTDGIRSYTPGVFALTGGRLTIKPGQVIEKGTLILRDGKIEAAGAEAQVPADAMVIDVTGKWLYAGLIDAYSESDAGDGAPAPAPAAGGRGRASAAPAAAPSGGANYWNANVTPQIRMEDSYSPDDGANRKYRSQGVGARLLAPRDGIIKGASALLSTGEGDGKRVILKGQTALHMKLTPSRGGRGSGYPGSPMGAYALVRQAFYDADWYGKAWDMYKADPALTRPERNDALAALQDHLGGKGLVVIDAPNEWYLLRADRIAREFSLRAAVLGSGREYRRLEEVAKTGRTIILPLELPKPPDVTSAEAAANATLDQLMHWDIAPENAGRVAAAGVQIALTAHGLKEEFLPAVRKAVAHGLGKDAALAAVTTTPAKLLGVESELGTLEAGRLGNVVVADGDLFEKKTKLHEVWVDGRRYRFIQPPRVDVRGKWELKLAAGDQELATSIMELAGEEKKPTGTVKTGDKSVKLTRVALAEWRLGLSAKSDEEVIKGITHVDLVITLEADGTPTLSGFGLWPNGDEFSITGRRTEPFKEKKDEKKPGEKAAEPEAPKPAAAADDEKKPAGDAKKPAGDEKKPAPDADKEKKGDKPDAKKEEKEKPARKPLYAVNYPLGAYGFSAQPEQPALVAFTNATIWTSGPAGILQNATMIVRQGKIVEVGKGIAIPEGAKVIDLAGRHIAPGIIDCHSHIASDGGINEGAQAVTAEVRIGDFIHPDDIAIYRQLAGGVTAANILHGSANPIGGQNQVIKLRWGGGDEAMKFAGAAPGIKFALGENPKQSNWENPNPRYPQSRMGVEQVIRDSFTAARDYGRRWDQWKQDRKGLPPRVDLELQTILEILNKQRMIHCHSYRQDEILALLRTCESFGIKVDVLQHILEGYKVAGEMKRHGSMASTFSDWWAYKFEVYDAIPYNGALMHQVGIVVSFNSDDAEMGRRMNQEAAKAVKYGGVPPAEALKFVTLNAAKQLRIEDRTGSLEAGKDADFAIWSVSPLSPLSRCEQTWIDGRRYFDLEADMKMRAEARSMRAALIQRVLESGEKPASTDRGEGEPSDDEHDDACLEFWPFGKSF